MQDYIKVCEKAVRAAGAVLMAKIGRVEVHEKARSDLVTEADWAAQQAVRGIILDAFADHAVIGEEDPPGGTTWGDRGEYCWIVDPLDGTTNYVHQVPHFCVSLALVRNGQLLVGAVYDPVADECFTAAVGEGARLNGRQIRPSRVSQLSGALAAVGFPPNVRRDSPDLLVFLEAIFRCQAIRRTGSAALNLCYLAAGRFDATWTFSTKIWDVAAGALIIREAGGIVTSPGGGDFVLETGQLLAAANQPLHDQLRELVADAI